MQLADNIVRLSRVTSLSLFVLVLAVIPAHAETTAPEPTPPKKPADPPAGTVEVHLTDGGVLKVTLRDERLEVQTRYGKLFIPVGEVQRLDVGFRLPADVARRIDAAIADLGRTDYKVRESASATLLELQEKAYPALLKAEKDADAEVARRARDLLEQIREAVPAERLEFLPYDVIWTEESKIAGHITASALKVHTTQFGDQLLRLTDVRTLTGLAAVETEARDALPDPGTLTALQNQVGKTYAFVVTGALAAAPPPGFVPQAWGRGLWGNGVYTVDSALALAAVHAGLLRPGQTGVVRVLLIGPQAGFQGATRNGVTSQPYGAYNGFKFVRGRAWANP
jgi:hypothetical protein